MYPFYMHMLLSSHVTTSRSAVMFFVQNGATMAKIGKQEIYLIHEVLYFGGVTHMKMCTLFFLKETKPNSKVRFGFFQKMLHIRTTFVVTSRILYR